MTVGGCQPADVTAPVRVLWLVKGLGPGGAEQLIVNQALARDREGFDCRAAFLVPWKNHQVSPLESSGVPVTCLDGPREWDLRWALRLRGLLRADPVDVVHNHSPYVASVTRLLVRTLPRSRRPRLVYTEHNRWPRHSPFTRWANRATFRLDDAQFAVSEDVRDTIPPRLRSRVTTLVHGIDLDEVRARAGDREAVRSELGIAGDEVVIGTVANFRKEKAYPDLLHAAARALVDEPRLRFVSVGQGPLEDVVRSLHADLGLGDRFMILGYREDAVRIMSAFDVFTLASVHEGLPVSLMDAMALGTAVVATAVGGVPQVVREGVEGLLTTAGRPDELAAAYVRVARDPQLRRSLGEAASAASERFDITVPARTIEDTYAHVAGRSRPGTRDPLPGTAQR